MFRFIARLWSGNRFWARDIGGNAVIGDVSGIVIQTTINGPSPEPPTLPWRDLAFGQDVVLSIFNLLTWRSRLAPFLVGRENDRKRLLAWARDDCRPIALRLLTGPGGAGKSRLAAEVADELRKSAWSTGIVQLDRKSTLPFGKGGLFVAIDYPEANRENVRALLREVGRLEHPPGKIRLLLVSRHSTGWWRDDVIASGASELCDSHDIEVTALTAQLTYSLVRAVALRVAELRGTPTPILDEAAITEWHARNPALHGLPLIATAAAVHAVLDPAPTFSLAGTEIIEALVARERRRLNAAAMNAGWPEKAGSRLRGLAALRTGLDEQSLKRLAQTAPDIGLPPSERIVDEVQALGWWTDFQVRALQPDILAAELLYQVLAGSPASAPDWLSATLADPEAIEVDRLSRVVHDMETLRNNAARTFVSWLRESVDRSPELAKLWCPILNSDVSTFRLAPVAVTIGRRLLEDRSLADSDRADIFYNLSARLNDAGERAAALAAIQDAVEIRRRLARENPACFEAELAMSLNHLSICLSGAGDRAAAYRAVREAVEIRRRLACENPTRFEADLASSLNNLSSRLIDIGDRAAALEAVREAAEIRRRLARDNPARFEAELASSLNNLSNRLIDIGDRAAALKPIRESVEIRRRLARENPAQFELDLASGLHALSYYLLQAGDYPAALEAARESVEIRRRLARENPARFEPDLAGVLHNLAVASSNVRNIVAAFDAIREAVEINRRLARENPARFEPDLAAGLHTLSFCLLQADDYPAALEAAQESVEIRRRLARENPARFEPDLAGVLHNLAVASSNIRNKAVALEAARDAVEIRHRLARENPARFEPDLASSLNRLSICLIELGDEAAALKPIRDAVEISRRLARENPARFEPDLAGRLHTLSYCLLQAGENAAALEAARESVEIRRRLARENPARFEPDLAGVLHNLAIASRNVGNKVVALEAAQDAVEIRRRLAHENPTRFEAALAGSLQLLSTLGD